MHLSCIFGAIWRYNAKKKKQSQTFLFRLDSVSLKKQNFITLISLLPVYHQIPPNIQLNWIKHFYRGKQSSSLDKVQNNTNIEVDYSSSNNFDFVAGGH